MGRTKYHCEVDDEENIIKEERTSMREKQMREEQKGGKIERTCKIKMETRPVYPTAEAFGCSGITSPIVLPFEQGREAYCGNFGSQMCTRVSTPTLLVKERGTDWCSRR